MAWRYSRPPDSTDGAVTSGDVLGWYDGNPDPAFLDAGVSRTGLDFALPTAKILAAGPNAIIGLYAGSWGVYGAGPYGDLCYGDPACSSPTVVNLAAGEVRTGIDSDFRVTAAVPASWGRIKELYR